MEDVTVEVQQYIARMNEIRDRNLRTGDEILNRWADENNTQLTKKRNMAREEKKIVVKDILEMLKKGHTRYKKDDQGFGNIQEKLGLTIAEMQEIFKHPKLAGKKTIFPSRIKLIDEDEPKVEEKKEEDKKEDEVFS